MKQKILEDKRAQDMLIEANRECLEILKEYQRELQDLQAAYKA